MQVHEDALGRTEFVFEDDRDFEQLQIVANKDLVIHGGGGEIDLADLGVDPEGETVAGLEGNAAEDGELLGMIGVVGGYAHFASGDDARTTVLDGRFFHDQLTGEVNDGAVHGRQCAKFVGGFCRR